MAQCKASVIGIIHYRSKIRQMHSCYTQMFLHFIQPFKWKYWSNFTLHFTLTGKGEHCDTLGLMSNQQSRLVNLHSSNCFFTACHKMSRCPRTWLIKLWKLIWATIIIMWAPFSSLNSGLVVQNVLCSFNQLSPLSKVTTLVSPSC